MKHALISLLVFVMTAAVSVSCAVCVCNMAMNHKDNAFHRVMKCCPPGADCGASQLLAQSCGDARSAVTQALRLNFEPLLVLITHKVDGSSLFLRIGNTRGVSPPPFTGHFSSTPIYLQTSTFLI